MTRTLFAVILAVAPAIAQAPELPADWGERDLEGKWVVYRRAIDAAKDPKKLSSAWAEQLGALREYELLEWLAVFDDSQAALAQLERADAPQWIRAAVWNVGNFDSHGQDAAAKLLLGHAPRVRAWFENNPPIGSPAVQGVRTRIEAAAERGEPVATDLPALDPMQLLVPSLDAPARLAEFGDRLTAEPKVRYVHQVLRALGGLSVSGTTDEGVTTKVVRLTQHDEAKVRRAAFDALGKLPPGLVPLEPMRRIVDDAAASVERRRFATLTMSHSSHPRAQQELVRVALDRSHPANDVAIRRLGEVGDPVGAAPVQAAVADAEARLDPALEVDLSRALDAILRRKHARAFGQPLAVRELLQRVAWLRVQHADDAGAVERATRELLRESLPGGEFGARLDFVAAMAAPPSPFRGDEAERVERALAQLIDEWRGAKSDGK